MVRYELGKWNLSELVKNPTRSVFDKKLSNIENSAKNFENVKLKTNQINFDFFKYL